MAAANQYMKAAADTIFELSSDENIRELCRRRADYEAYERYNAAEHTRKDAIIAELSDQLSQNRDTIAKKDFELAQSRDEIARLRALLNQNTNISI